MAGKAPQKFKSMEEAWQAYLYHRMHPTPRQLAERPLTQAMARHMEGCPRCAKIFEAVDNVRDMKSPRDWCRVDPVDFAFVSVGDIRTLAFDRFADEERGKFLNAPEVCVIAAPPRLSMLADVVVAQAIPERFELLAAKEDVRAPSAGYILESWNIYTVPAVALTEFGRNLFPSTFRHKCVPDRVIRQMHALRKAKTRPSGNPAIERFRESEKNIARKSKEIIAMLRLLAR